MGRHAFKLPDIGEGIAEAEIVAWHVKVGDTVAEDDPLCDMMTDKATVEMTAPVAGVVTQVAGEVGDQIAIGSVLAEFETEGGAVPENGPPAEVEGALLDPVGVGEGAPEHAVEADKPFPLVGEGREKGREQGERPAGEQSRDGASSPDARTPIPGPPPQEGRELAAPAGYGDQPRGEMGVPAAHRTLASPAVRARARDLGIDLAQVRGEGGRIRHADLDAFLTYNQGYRSAGPKRADEQVRVVGLRRRIAENMVAAKRAIPHFTYVDELDVSKLEALRADLNDTRGDKPRLTMLPLLIVALCKALPDFPMLNARYDDEAGVVTRFGAVHLGIATQTDAGLMVPVLRDAQSRNVWQLGGEIRRLAEAARSGKAKSEELSGSTITLTSLGPLGGIVTTPVINRPEVAIIGPNKVVERPVVRDGAIVVAKVMNLSISCDHRVVDGHDAASFVQAVRRLVETPALLFVD